MALPPLKKKMITPRGRLAKLTQKLERPFLRTYQVMFPLANFHTVPGRRLPMQPQQLKKNYLLAKI
jgi:hypothetical protein